MQGNGQVAEEGAAMRDSTNDIGEARTMPRLSRSLDLQPLFQTLLATLANLDFDYERERERVSRSTTDPHMSTRLLRRLEERHRERRDPYIRHLAILQDRMVAAQCH
jgi:hypothetical protein